jgi:hypothetical protein
MWDTPRHAHAGVPSSASPAHTLLDETSRRDAQAFWDGEYIPVPQLGDTSASAAAAGEASRVGSR